MCISVVEVSTIMPLHCSLKASSGSELLFLVAPAAGLALYRKDGINDIGTKYFILYRV